MIEAHHGYFCKIDFRWLFCLHVCASRHDFGSSNYVLIAKDCTILGSWWLVVGEIARCSPLQLISVFDMTNYTPVAQ